MVSVPAQSYPPKSEQSHRIMNVAHFFILELIVKSNKFMHGFVKFFLLRSLLLCFCTVLYCEDNTKNAMHKFVEVLDNPHYLCAIFKTIVYPDFGL